MQSEEPKPAAAQVPQKTPENRQCPVPPGGDTGHSGTFRGTPNEFNESGEPGQSGDPGENEDLAGLSEIQFQSIILAMQGLSDSEIARTLSINRKTLWRWRSHDDVYRMALVEARENLHEAAIDHYQLFLEKATRVLGKFLDDASDNKRFRAAQAFLCMSGSFRPRRTAAAVKEKEDMSLPDIPEYWLRKQRIANGQSPIAD